MKRFIQLFALVLVLSMAACIGDFFVVEPTAVTLLDKTALAETTTETNIEIDGLASDWENRTLYISDRSGDSMAGFLDLTNGYAFVNQDALYFLVETADPDQSFSQIDINIKADGNDYKIFWKPGDFGSYVGVNEDNYLLFEPTVYTQIAYVKVVEGRIDLRDLGSPEEISLESVNIMAGDCCSGGKIEVADSWLNSTTVFVNERDAKNVAGEYRTASLVATATPTVLAARKAHYSLAGTGEPAYLYRSDLQTPVDAAYGQDGYFYVADEAGRHLLRISVAGSIEELGVWQYGIFETAGPRYLAFNSAGELFFTVDKHIYKVGKSGIPEKIIIPGGDVPIGGIAIDPEDNLYYTLHDEEGTLMQWVSDDIGKKIAEGLTSSSGDMKFGSDETLYVALNGVNKVVRVNVTTGEVVNFFENDFQSGSIFLATDKDGYIWMRGDDCLYKVGPNGIARSFLFSGWVQSGIFKQANDYLFKLSTAAGIDFDTKDRMWIASFDGRVIRFQSPELSPEEIGYQFEFNAPKGLTASGMDVRQDGTVYAFNSLNKELWKIGTAITTVPLESLDEDIVPLAVGADGIVYVSAKSQIFTVGTNGQLQIYNTIKTQNMEMGVDGDLYVSFGKAKSNKIIYRVTEKDGYYIFITEIDGDKLGLGNIGEASSDFEIYIARTDGGFYIFDESYSRLYFVDYQGKGRIITDVPVAPEGIDALAATPSGKIFIIYHDSAEVYQVDSQTGELSLYASGLIGDPRLMSVSPDGKWLYIAENGAIDKLPITP